MLNHIKAALGSIFIGVTLPSILVCLHLYEIKLGGPPHEIMQEEFVILLVAGTIFCGPGASVLSSILLLILERRSLVWTLQQTMWGGVLGGIAMAFLNVPGYMVGFILEDDPYVYSRVTLLFAVAGSTCGLWIAWVAWRSQHPGERFLPRFSLRTLIVVVLLWGAVMLAFQPKQHDFIRGPRTRPHVRKL
ncbi:MAG: hypothetical protein WCT04_13040 [Planctomycetota bacterium]